MFSVNNAFTIQSVPEGKFSILGGHSIGHSKQKDVYIYIYRIQNGFRDTTISLYSSKFVERKEILRTVSNCSSDKFGTVYLV
jgi:hypothetical protein